MFRKKERKKKGNKPEFFADIPSCNNEKKRCSKKLNPTQKTKTKKARKKEKGKQRRKKMWKNNQEKNSLETKRCHFVFGFSRRFIDRWKRMEVFPGCNKLVLSDSMDCIDWFLCLCITKHNKS